MSTQYLPPLERTSRPEQTPPPGATDCHAHVFGPYRQFPLTAHRSYTPPELPAARYLAMLDEIGFARGVLVQPTAHGTDCRALTHAIQTEPARLRGIAVVGADISDGDLALLDRQGIRGARFIRPPASMYRGWIGFDALEKLAPRFIELGWHAQVWAHCDALVEALPRLLGLGVPLVVDHMSYFDVARGVGDRSFQAILRWVGAGRLWLKLGSFRLSKQYPDYADVLPFHQALVAANPERLLWGSDWPHVHMTAEMPDVGDLVDLLQRWTPDAAARRRILVDNPAALYGF